MKRFLLVFAGLLLSASVVNAQFQGKVFEESDHIKVTGYGGAERSMPWMGGFSTPQLTMGDLNHDGKNDLVVFEKSTGTVKTFINTGTAGNPKYVYSPKFAANFQNVISYLILADYNCDGIVDLFHKGQKGISVSKGYYNSSNELAFTFYRYVEYQQPNGWVNAFVSNDDIPAIADVDGDGDLDFLAFDIFGGNRIDYYRNLRVEKNLPCDSIRISLKSECWGKMYQPFFRTHVLSFNCAGLGFVDSLVANSPGNGPGTSSGMSTAKTTLHTGNAMCVLDLDGDGDVDYLDGNISFNDIQMGINGKAQYGGKDSIVSQDTTWLGIKMSNWPAIFNLDIDQDGKKDLLVTPHADNTSENYKTVQYYRNTSNTSVPNFVYQKDTLLVENSLDAGSHSYPTFYDFNKDGKPDLFIGSAGYYQPNGSLQGKLTYLLNTSTTGNPSFDLRSSNFMGLSSRNYEGIAPAFGDLDNDGKDDMVLGHNNGTVSFYKNYAATASATPVWQLASDTLKDQFGFYIDPGDFSTPLIYDMDKDGKKDLILGSSSGRLMFYRGTGAAGTVSLEKGKDSLGRIQVDPDYYLQGYSTPFIGRMDNSVKEYLMTGSYTGALYRYDNFQSGAVNQTYTRLDSVYSSIKGLLRTAPAVADVDGDGKYDMVLGNYHGGVLLYKQMLNVDPTIGIAGVEQDQVAVFPNPAKRYVQAHWSFGTKSGVASITDMAGRVVAKQTINQGQREARFDTQGLQSGLYFIVLQVGEKKAVIKFSVTH